MKILHVLPSIRSGGVASVVYNLAKYQRTQKDEVNLYITRPQIQFRARESDFTSIGVKVLYSRYPNRYDIRHMTELKKLMKMHDIVHVHLFPDQLWVSLAYRFLPLLQRPALITTEHNTYNNRRKYSFLRYFDRFLYAPFDNIICIGDQTKRNLDNWLKSSTLKDKSIVITNGVDIESITQAKTADITFLNLPKNSKIVIMVARLIHPKDPLTLVRAINLCPENIHAIFIGYGPQEKEIECLSHDLGINHRIHQLGMRNNVYEFLKSADLGILSTHWDGFGLVAVEYMAAGIPVIASDVDGLRDVVGKNECLFKTGDHETLSSKIINILSDKELNDKLSAFFMDRAKSFDVKVMNGKYYTQYEKLITTKNGDKKDI